LDMASIHCIIVFGEQIIYIKIPKAKSSRSSIHAFIAIQRRKKERNSSRNSRTKAKAQINFGRTITTERDEGIIR